MSPNSGKQGRKVISIPRSLAKQCLMENLKYHREHTAWKKRYFQNTSQQRYMIWIQFDPVTGASARLLVTFPYNEDQYMSELRHIMPDLAHLKPGWLYFRIMVPTEDWEVDAYLNDSPGLEMSIAWQDESHRIEQQYQGHFV